MIPELHIGVSLLFIVATFVTIYFFLAAGKSNLPAVLVIAGLLLIQALLVFSGFLTQLDSMPPRMLAVIFPPFATIGILFSTRKGRAYLDSYNPALLTWLHIIRVPVEIVLWFLFLAKWVPDLVTFEGRNFDIFSGLTAPLIAWLGYHKLRLSKSVLLAWNFICLALVLNVVGHGILSAPTPLQLLAFDQPNAGMFYFPFVWLPGIVVPLVVLSHLICIRQLRGKTS